MSSCPLSGRHEPLPAAWAFLESGGARLSPQPGEPPSTQPPSAAAVPETPPPFCHARGCSAVTGWHLQLSRQVFCRPQLWEMKVPRVAGGENAATFFLLWSARKCWPVAASLPRPQEVRLVGVRGRGPARPGQGCRGFRGPSCLFPPQASWWLQGPLCPLLNGLFCSFLSFVNPGVSCSAPHLTALFTREQRKLRWDM